MSKLICAMSQSKKTTKKRRVGDAADRGQVSQHIAFGWDPEVGMRDTDDALLGNETIVLYMHAPFIEIPDPIAGCLKYRLPLALRCAWFHAPKRESGTWAAFGDVWDAPSFAHVLTVVTQAIHDDNNVPMVLLDLVISYLPSWNVLTWREFRIAWTNMMTRTLTTKERDKLLLHVCEVPDTLEKQLPPTSFDAFSFCSDQMTLNYNSND